MKNTYGPVYRGERLGGGIHTKLPSITFCSDVEVAKQYALTPDKGQQLKGNPYLTVANIIIEKPIIHEYEALVDLYFFKDKIREEDYSEFITYIVNNFKDDLTNTNAFDRLNIDVDDFHLAVKEARIKLTDLIINMWRLLDDKFIIDKLKASGYDGAIHRGSGISMDAYEYRVFNINQIYKLSFIKI